MSADFWAGYISGAAGIVIGNPLDIVKVRLQANAQSPPIIETNGSAGVSSSTPLLNRAEPARSTSLVRGVAAPILGYGALNALLFVTYNRTLVLLDPTIQSPQSPPPSTSLLPIWTAGAIGGLASFIVSAPTELIKCRAQLGIDGETSSLSIAKAIYRADGLRGFYLGGGVTSLRDSIGYGFYFWSYELGKRWFDVYAAGTFAESEATKSLLCGGVAGVVTWASIFPLDVIKTRLQTQSLKASVIDGETVPQNRSKFNAWSVGKTIAQAEGASALFRGLGVCSLRAFIVNAAQWAIYEWIMRSLTSKVS